MKRLHEICVFKYIKLLFVEVLKYENVYNIICFFVLSFYLNAMRLKKGSTGLRICFLSNVK